MKYELEPDNRNCPDETLLADLRIVATRLSKLSLTKDEYNAHGRFSAATMQNRFGSWNKALLQGNLSIGKRNSIPEDELLLDLRRVSEKLGTSVLSMQSYRAFGMFSTATFPRTFGTWEKALAAAGLQVSSQWHPKVSDDDLLSNMARVWETVGRQPKQSDFRQPVSRISADSYTRRFGSWRKALETFVDFANEEATVNDVANDSAAEAVVARIPEKGHRTQRDPSWRLRFLVNRRDRFTCRCGRSPANEIGVILHVDHVHPWSQGGETTFDNLQTLCERCNIGKGDLSMYDEGADAHSAASTARLLASGLS